MRGSDSLNKKERGFDLWNEKRYSEKNLKLSSLTDKKKTDNKKTDTETNTELN